MATTYDRHVFKQLQDVLKKCDNLSQEIKDIKKEHREEIFKLNEKHKQEINDLKEEHKKEINDLNIKIDALEIENKILKEDITVQDSKYLRDEERPVLNRLKKYKKNHLLFAYNFIVPFDNNLSERDLRPIKTKLKISRRP